MEEPSFSQLPIIIIQIGSTVLRKRDVPYIEINPTLFMLDLSLFCAHAYVCVCERKIVSRRKVYSHLYAKMAASMEGWRLLEMSAKAKIWP